MTYRKKLIEVALPLEAINKASAREKSIRHGHPSTLHLWWARRPLAACRAVIFSSLVDDPDDPDAPPEFVQACRNLPRGKNAAENDTPRQRLFDFVETLVQWESTTDEQVLETARHLIRLATDGNPPPLLDPFAGGGSIPLEAQRLGLEAHASDLNPVAVMINKALIEIPPRFADMPPVNPRDREGTAGNEGWKGAAGLAADVRYYGEWMRDRAWERIGHLYPKCNGETVIAWIWARTVESPNPALDMHVPLVSSFWLSKKREKPTWVEPKIDLDNKRITYHVHTGSGEPPRGTMRRSGGTCIVTGVPITRDYIRAEGQLHRMGVQLMTVITEGSQGRNYYPPNEYHAQVAFKGTPSWKPEVPLANNPRHMSPPLYGMELVSDIFTNRQLVAITTFSNLVRDVYEQVLIDGAGILLGDGFGLRVGGRGLESYAETISVYMSFLVDQLANHQSSVCGWNVVNAQMRNVFARQAVSMSWDFAESNPFCESSGSYHNLFERFIKAFPALPSFLSGRAEMFDATAPRDNIERVIVSTDPPYYDNVPYADLSDFFYVWLRRNLANIYPEVFGTMLVPKQTELVADPVRYVGTEQAQRHFEEGLERAFHEMHKIVHPDYPLTVYYAFKQSEIVQDSENGQSSSSTGWETMLEGLIRSGFTINSTWPIRTERRGRMREIDSNALASSIVLSCHPRPDDISMTSRREFVNALRQELPAALREMQSGNIAPVDLAQASIGPGMAVYSRYSQVLEPNGDRLTVRTALQIINHELDAYLAEQEGHIDADSRFALAWFEQFGFQEGAFGQADVLARAKNTSVDGLAHAGVLVSGAGKVRLYHWSELDPGWDPTTDSRLTVWEAIHHLIERINTHGEEGAARLLAKMPSDLAAQARQLAYRLYSICERKGWAEQARDYNALAISWSASQEQAREFKEQYQQGTLF
ncbi:MAG: DUF1156 domain-containing protein [Chloroflexota bacterium]|nr:DUF1156 domain-containing protein [Chloroflexota bacterium]